MIVVHCSNEFSFLSTFLERTNMLWFAGVKRSFCYSREMYPFLSTIGVLWFFRMERRIRRVHVVYRYWRRRRGLLATIDAMLLGCNTIYVMLLWCNTIYVMLLWWYGTIRCATVVEVIKMRMARLEKETFGYFFCKSPKSCREVKQNASWPGLQCSDWSAVKRKHHVSCINPCSDCRGAFPQKSRYKSPGPLLFILPPAFFSPPLRWSLKCNVCHENE